MTFISIRNLTKIYNKSEIALNNLSFEIPKGKVIAMVGESGSGKSTLLRIIAGLETQDKGEVLLNESRIQNPKEKLVPGYDEIQLVHQGFKLYPNSTVKENISRPLLHYDKNYREERLNKIIRMLGLIPHQDKFPRQLSGGQQQKVAVGRALSLEPEVLLLDEPFSNLDTIQRRELIEELKSMFTELSITVLFVTHDLDDALQMTDELIIIQKGKLIQRGDSFQIFRNPKNLYTAKLFSHLNPIPDRKGAYIRPSDLKLLKGKGLQGQVISKQYLVHYNLLIVKLKDSGSYWKVEDSLRRFELGNTIYLRFEESKVLSF